MLEAKIGRRYASAIYDIAESKGKVKEVHEILSLMMELYKGNKEFKNLVDHPLVRREDKKEFLSKILKGTEEFSHEVIDYLVDKGRLSNIRGIVAEYVKIYYEKEYMIDVEGIFAIEPSEVQREKLIQGLAKRTGKKVNLKVTVDKNIIAGGILKIGDEIIDGSMRRQLDTLVEKL